MPPTDETPRDPRVLRYALQFLLIAAFLTGGSSQISGWDDAVVQLIALPVLALGLWRIPTLPRSKIRSFALMIAGLIALVPLVQLLPLPESMWLAPEARQSLAMDLSALDVVPPMTWSLIPSATERAFLFLLPPLALFVAALGMGEEMQWRLLRTVMLLVLFSLALAFLQLGVPAQSVLNPFPQWAAQFNGVFANQNHQGIALVVAIVIALTGVLASIPHVNEGRAMAWKPWILGFAALFMLCALPLTQSRGAVLIGTFAVAAVPLGMGQFDRRHLRTGWGPRAGLAACLALVVLGIWATIGWMQVDMVDELRRPMRVATAELGYKHAYLGAGVGSFVEVFAQGSSPDLLLHSYINHAHNEYLQWWLEFGWLGLLITCIALAFAWVLIFRSLKLRAPYRWQAVAACTGLLALLAHSWVDYPLRTGSLAAIAGVLAAVLVAHASRQIVYQRSDGFGKAP